MAIEILVPLAVSIIALLAIVFMLKRPIQAYLERLTKQIAEDSIRITEEKSKNLFEAERKIINTDLEGKKDLIAELVSNIRKEINQSQEKLITSEQSRIKEFENLRTIVSEHKTITESLKGTTDDLRKILSNNQLRGAYGQQVAEDLLKMAGFVRGTNYTSQTQQETASSIPDFTIFLPDKTKINIDVKFPYQALQKAQTTEDPHQRKQYLDEFKNDIKAKIKEVTTRDYINPEENTVDFVVMFIPNEMIFSYVYETFPEVWDDAIRKKVVMCGPFSFTAILRMVQQAYDNFRYQKNILNIIGQIKKFEMEYEKFSKELDLLGKHLKSATNQYEEVSTTRQKKLLSVVEKIKTEELAAEEKDLLEAPLRK